MMASYTCACGVRYQLPGGAGGQQLFCRQCGKAFVIPSEADESAAIPLADADGDVTSPVANRGHSDLAHGGLPPVPPGVVDTEVDAGGTHVARPLEGGGQWDHQPRLRRSFGSDVRWAFLFFTDPTALITFFLIWAGLAVGGVIPVISILVGFWYCAFRFEVVQMASAGQEGLPSVGWTNIFEDLIMPAIYWSASWMVVLVPAGLYVVVGLKGGWVSWNAVSAAMLQGISGLLTGLGGVSLGFAALVYGGIFFWPIVVLCLALGGPTTLYRLDLILKTVVRTFLGYAWTVGIVVGVIVLSQYLGTVTSAAPAAAPGGPAGLGIVPTDGLMRVAGQALAARVLTVGVTLYAEIVAMRVIGLYYHHHKRRFAWSWG